MPRDEQSDKMRAYELLLRAKQPDADWRFIVLDLGDRLNALLGGGELSSLIASDPDLKAWETLRTARLYRNRAAHPNAEIPGIPVQPTIDQWQAAAATLLRACNFVIGRSVVEEVSSWQPGDAQLQGIDGSNGDLSIVDGAQDILATILAAVTVVNLTEMEARCISVEQRSAIARVEEFSERARLGLLADRPSEEVNSDVAAFLGDCIRAMPPRVMSEVCTTLIKTVGKTQERRVSLEDQSLLGWLSWFISYAHEDDVLKARYAEAKVHPAVLDLELSLRRRATGVVFRNWKERAFCFVRSADGSEYYLNYNSCTPELRSVLEKSGFSERIRVEFDVRPAARADQKAKAVNARQSS